MLWAVVALLMGGILKGATGAGAPIIAIPVIAMAHDVPFAIVILTMPNLISNVWQGWTYRAEALPLRFTASFALAGALGAGLGTVMLANLPSEVLLILVALSVFAYVGFRLARPNWSLPFATAERIVLPVGTVAGMMQGAAGVSAPVSISFLNALKPERGQFVATISVFFVAMVLVQLPLLGWYGFLSWERILWSTAALIPIFAGMPIGTYLTRHISKQAFDRLTLALLFAISVKLVAQALL